MKGKCVVLVGCASRREAERIARALVENRLAACVNLFPSPVESVYRWKGKVERAREALLVIKTSLAQFPKLERRVRALHSYQTPEIVAVPIVAGSRGYLDWMEKSLGDRRKSDAKAAPSRGGKARNGSRGKGRSTSRLAHRPLISRGSSVGSAAAASRTGKV